MQRHAFLHAILSLLAVAHYFHQMLTDFYICQVNGVKLADILFYLHVRPSVCAHSYLDANISKTV